MTFVIFDTLIDINIYLLTYLLTCSCTLIGRLHFANRSYNQILKRWAEHFESVLNQSAVLDKAVVGRNSTMGRSNIPGSVSNKMKWYMKSECCRLASHGRRFHSLWGLWGRWKSIGTTVNRALFQDMRDSQIVPQHFRDTLIVLIFPLLERSSPVFYLIGLESMTLSHILPVY